VWDKDFNRAMGHERQSLLISLASAANLCIWLIGCLTIINWVIGL